MFAKSTLCTPFRVFTRVGHELIKPVTDGTLSGVVSAVLIVEESSGTESDLLDFFCSQVIWYRIVSFHINFMSIVL